MQFFGHIATLLLLVFCHCASIESRLIGEHPQQPQQWPTYAPLQSPALLRALIKARSVSSSPVTTTIDSVESTQSTANDRMTSANTLTSNPTSGRSRFVPTYISIRPYSVHKKAVPVYPSFESNSIERDDIPVIAFTRVKGQARFVGQPAVPITGSNIVDEQGVGPAVSVSPAGSTEAGEQFSDEIGNESNDASDLHPVYIQPPTNFKPVLYADRRMDGQSVGQNPSLTVASPITHSQNRPARLPYPYPNGLSSWMLGGVRGVERGGYWERLGSNQALPALAANPSATRSGTRLTPAAQSVWFVQSIPESSDKPVLTMETPDSNGLVDKIDLVSLGDQAASDKDVYETSSSNTIQHVSLPSSVPSNRFKFVIDSKQDLMTSATQNQSKRV